MVQLKTISLLNDCMIKCKTHTRIEELEASGYLVINVEAYPCVE